MSHRGLSDATRRRIARWVIEAKPIETKTTWTEQRLAIDFGGHTYIINNGQIYQCAHCGHYDPEWNITEVISYFRETFNIKPYEIEITCTVA